MRSVNYLLRSALLYFNELSCPYCGHGKYIKIDHKYLVTRLMQCENCGLMYRTPKDRHNFNEAFYNEGYEEKGLTTELPDAITLEYLINTNFANSEKEFSTYISIFDIIKQGRVLQNIVDYGANWGYGSLQFQKAGYKTQSYEISKPRANFGKSALKLNISSNLSDIAPGNDLFFSAHVIEHLNDIATFLSKSKELLKPDGLFFAACPNGSEPFRINHKARFHLAWGLVHPNYISDRFYKFVFRNSPYLISSQLDFTELLKKWDYKTQVNGDLSGSELYVISMPNISIHK